MSMDFTVIQPVRQRFGDGRIDLEPKLAELEAPFVGLAKDFRFSCPDVDPAQWAVLQFETLGATAPRADQRARPRNILRINDTDIPGGITAGAGEYWKTHNLLVPPNVLRQDNVLHIESVVIFQEHSVHHDDFIIDNMIILYKMRGIVRPGGVIKEEVIELAH